MGRICLLIGLAGCASSPEGQERPENTADSDPPELDSACGDVERFDATLLGVVEDDGAAVAGATVTIEDRYWEPGTLGTTTTDTDGRFVLEARNVHAVEDCWVFLDYVVVASAGEKSAEKAVTAYLKVAWGTTGEADLTATPIELD